MTQEHQDYLKIARENYGWAGFALACITMIFKAVRQPALVVLKFAVSPFTVPASIKSIADDIRFMKETSTKGFHDARKRFTILEAHIETMDSDSGYRRWKCNEEGECVFATPQLAKLFRLSIADMLGFGWTRVIHPDDQQKVLEHFRHSMLDPAVPYMVRYRLLFGDESLTVVARGRMIKDDETHQTIYSIGTVDPLYESTPSTTELKAA